MEIIKSVSLGNVCFTNKPNIFQTNSIDVYNIFKKYKIKHDHITTLIDFFVTDNFLKNIYPDVEYLIRFKCMSLSDALLAVLWVIVKREWDAIYSSAAMPDQLRTLRILIDMISNRDRPLHTYFLDRPYNLEDYLTYILVIIIDGSSNKFTGYTQQCYDWWPRLFKIVKASPTGRHDIKTDLIPNNDYIVITNFDTHEQSYSPYVLLFKNFTLQYAPDNLSSIVINKCISKINLAKISGIVPPMIIDILKDRANVIEILTHS